MDPSFTKGRKWKGVPRASKGGGKGGYIGESRKDAEHSGSRHWEGSLFVQGNPRFVGIRKTQHLSVCLLIETPREVMKAGRAAFSGGFGRVDEKKKI